MSLKFKPPSVETCHCTVGAGEPLAAAVKVASAPSHTVLLLGFVVTPGAAPSGSVAAVVAAVLHTLVKTARYCLPLSAATVVKLYVVFVAPPISLKFNPPSVESCHCTVGAGEPLAAAVKVAIAPSQTVLLFGFVVTAGGVLTVSVAAVVVAVPHELVNTARYCSPLSAANALNV